MVCKIDVKIKLKSSRKVKKPLYSNPTKITIGNQMVDFENDNECGYLNYSDFDEIIITSQKEA